MAELADAADSKSADGDIVRVRFPLSALTDNTFWVFLFCKPIMPKQMD